MSRASLPAPRIRQAASITTAASPRASSIPVVMANWCPTSRWLGGELDDFCHLRKSDRAALRVERMVVAAVEVEAPSGQLIKPSARFLLVKMRRPSDIIEGKSYWLAKNVSCAPAHRRRGCRDWRCNGRGRPANGSGRGCRTLSCYDIAPFRNEDDPIVGCEHGVETVDECAVVGPTRRGWGGVRWPHVSRMRCRRR